MSPWSIAVCSVRSCSASARPEDQGADALHECFDEREAIRRFEQGARQSRRHAQPKECVERRRRHVIGCFETGGDRDACDLLRRPSSLPCEERQVLVVIALDEIRHLELVEQRLNARDQCGRIRSRRRRLHARVHLKIGDGFEAGPTRAAQAHSAGGRSPRAGSWAGGFAGTSYGTR